MVGLLDEHNMIADIDATSNQAGPRRQVASTQPKENTFRESNNRHNKLPLNQLNTDEEIDSSSQLNKNDDTSLSTDTKITSNPSDLPTARESKSDAIETLFGLLNSDTSPRVKPNKNPENEYRVLKDAQDSRDAKLSKESKSSTTESTAVNFITNEAQRVTSDYQIKVSGPGVNTTLSITDEEDVAIAIALLQKIRRQLNAR